MLLASTSVVSDMAIRFRDLERNLSILIQILYFTDKGGNIQNTFFFGRGVWGGDHTFITLSLPVSSGKKSFGLLLYFCFLCFLVHPLSFCPIFFFIMRTAFPQKNKLKNVLLHFFEAKLNPCLGVLTFFELGFEFLF